MSYPNDTADSVTMGYDKANNITRVSSENGGRHDHVYDELNRVVSQTWTYGEQTYITSYHYNPAGCLDTMTYPTGTTLSMTCDSANRVKSVKVGSDVIVKEVTYHPPGQVAAMTYGSGVFGAVGSAAGDVAQNGVEALEAAGNSLSPGEENFVQGLRDLNGVTPQVAPGAVAAGQVAGGIVGGGSSFVPVEKEPSNAATSP